MINKIKIKSSQTKLLILKIKKNLLLMEIDSQNLENNLQINAETFEYYKSINKIIAKKNVILDDKQNQNKIFSNKITYFKDQEKFVTDGNSIALIGDKYEFKSSDVIFLKKDNRLSSKKNTTIIDNKNQFYKLANFQYSLNDKILKGQNILINTNYNRPNSDSFYLSSAIINLENKFFTAADTDIRCIKTFFQIKISRVGVSSKNKDQKTVQISNFIV